MNLLLTAELQSKNKSLNLQKWECICLDIFSIVNMIDSSIIFHYQYSYLSSKDTLACDDGNVEAIHDSVSHKWSRSRKTLSLLKKQTVCVSVFGHFLNDIVKFYLVYLSHTYVRVGQINNSNNQLGWAVPSSGQARLRLVELQIVFDWEFRIKISQ